MTLNHPIFARWPAQYPDRLQLFSLPTPNGVKVGIMLEETGLAYEPHRIDITADESHDPAFLALNPNGKIPAIYDPMGRAALRSRCSSRARSCCISPTKRGNLSRPILIPATKRSSG